MQQTKTDNEKSRTNTQDTEPLCKTDISKNRQELFQPQAEPGLKYGYSSDTDVGEAAGRYKLSFDRRSRTGKAAHWWWLICDFYFRCLSCGELADLDIWKDDNPPVWNRRHTRLHRFSIPIRKLFVQHEFKLFKSDLDMFLALKTHPDRNDSPAGHWG